MRIAWLIGLLVALGAGCSDDTTPKDSGLDQGGDVALPDLAALEAGPPGDLLATSPYTVGAVQLSVESANTVTGCGGQPGTCPLVTLVKEAASKGARLVVTPDYAAYVNTSGMAAPEAEPAVGDAPASDSRWAEGTVMHTMAELAVSEKIWLTFYVPTEMPGEPNQFRHSTIALDPQGAVRAVHHKYMLYGDETTKFKPGESLATSFFDGPLGKTGLMSTAEAQCFVVDGSVGGLCTAGASALYKSYLGEKPDVVLFSAWWTGGAGKWDAPNVMKTVATHLGAWLVVGNGTQTPYGHGGGIWRPDGSQLNVDRPTVATVMVDDVPAKGSWTPPDAGAPDAGTDATAPDATASDAAPDATTPDA